MKINAPTATLDLKEAQILHKFMTSNQSLPVYLSTLQVSIESSSLAEKTKFQEEGEVLRRLERTLAPLRMETFRADKASA